MERYGTVMERHASVAKALRGIVERYETLRSAVGSYGVVAERCRAL